MSKYVIGSAWCRATRLQPNGFVRILYRREGEDAWDDGAWASPSASQRIWYFEPDR